MKSEIFTAVKTWIFVFELWQYVILQIVTDFFGRSCCLHFEFSPEDRGSMFLRNFSSHLQGRTVSQPISGLVSFEWRFTLSGSVTTELISTTELTRHRTVSIDRY
jgi:hypothetical protein